MLLLAALCGLLAGQAAHAEKKVYKCTNADGSLVFSPNPCGAGAQEQKVDAGSAQANAPGTPATPPQMPSTVPAAPDSEAEDAKCRDDAQRLAVYPAEGNLQALMQHQAELVRAYAADQQASEAIKVQIGTLDGAIATEQERIAQGRSRVDRAYRDAIAKCDARKADRERQAERNRQAEHDLQAERERQAESERKAEQERQAEHDGEAGHPADPNGDGPQSDGG
jgi:colicin import membrane protein